MKHILIVILIAWCQGLSAQGPMAQLRTAVEAGDEAGLRLADSCIRVNVVVDSAYYYKSLLALKLGKLKSAKSEIDVLKKTYPSFYLSLYAEALYYFETEDYGRCVDKLNAVLKVDPKNTKCYYNRAVVSGLLDDYQGAIEDLNQCLLLEPRNSNFAYARAYWKEQRLMLADAIIDYEMALSNNTRLFDAYLGLANCYRLQKNTPKACEVMDRAEAAGSQIAADLRQSYCH